MKKILVGFLLSLAMASAGTLTLNLDTNTASLLPGQTATFTGTLTSTYSVDVDLNGLNINLPGDFLSDSLPFFLTGPLSIGANSTSAPFDLFTVMPNAPFSGPFGIYNGTISVLGGAQINGVYDPNVFDQLADQSFSVVVLDPGTTVPEPASGPVVLLVVAGALLYMRRVAVVHKARAGQASKIEQGEQGEVQS